MKMITTKVVLAVLIIATGCASGPKSSAKKETASGPAPTAVTTDSGKAEQEVAVRYAAASPEIKEYVLWTARSFGPSGMWLPEDKYVGLTGAGL